MGATQSNIYVRISKKKKRVYLCVHCVHFGREMYTSKSSVLNPGFFRSSFYSHGQKTKGIPYQKVQDGKEYKQNNAVEDQIQHNRFN